MLEMLMRPTTALPYYPDSGPGTKYLRMGDQQFGFFGTVPEADLGFFPKMLDDVGVSEANRTYKPAEINNWLKFFFRGSVLYIPSFNTAYVTYNQLQAAKMTYSALKKGTPDVPVTLPNGQPMYDMNPLYSAGNRDLLFVRLMDCKPNSSVAVFDEVFSGDSEVYNLITSTFGTNWTNPQGVKLPAALLTAFYAGGAAIAVGAETTSASSSVAFRVDPTSADLNKASQQGLTASILWMPVLQLLSAEDRKKLALPLEDIESWSDAVNSRPVSWAKVDSMIPPYNFRAPGSQTVIEPTVTFDGMRGIVINGYRGPSDPTYEYGEQAFMEPILLAPQTRNDSVAQPVERGLTPGDSVVFPDNMYEGTSIQCVSGWVQGDEMYTPFGMGGTQGGGEDKYPSYVSVFNWRTGAKRRIAPGSPSGFTWYSGTRHNNGRFYMAGGYIAGGQTKNMYSFPLSNPGAPTAHAVFPGTTRVITNMCSLPTQNKIMLLGGYNLSNNSYNEAALYDVATNAWTSIAPPGLGLYYASMAASDTKVYVVGGIQTVNSVSTVNNAIRIYDIASNTWTTVPTTFGFFKAIGQATFYNGHVIAIGGLDQTSQAFAYAVIFNVTTNEIRVKALGIPPQALGVCGMQDDGFIWVGPGVNPNRPGAYDDNRPRSLVARFDPAKLIAS